MSGQAARKLTRNEIERELKVLIIDALKLDETTPDDIDSEAPLVSAGLGLDSIDLLELAAALQRRFGVVSDGDDQTNARIYGSVSSLADFLEVAQAGGAALEPK
jgi:acyl carrier protein